MVRDKISSWAPSLSSLIKFVVKDINFFLLYSGISNKLICHKTKKIKLPITDWYWEYKLFSMLRNIIAKRKEVYQTEQDWIQRNPNYQSVLWIVNNLKAYHIKSTKTYIYHWGKEERKKHQITKHVTCMAQIIKCKMPLF